MEELTGTHRSVRELLDNLTAESTVALRRSGAGRMLQPRRYGGFELPTDEFVSAIYELAAVDGSLGWLTAMFNAGAYEVAGLPEYVAHDVWGADPDALITIAYRGSGALANGRLTGRWESVVGADQAEWLLLPVAKRVALVPRDGVRVEPVSRQPGLGAAGVCDLTASDLAVDDRHVFTNDRDRAAVIAGVGAAAAVVGSADGVWRTHVDQVRTRLATSYGGDEVTNEAAAQVARAASDIDAARLQLTASLQPPADLVAAGWAHRQAVARARGAADRLLGSSRHALDASDSVTHLWRDVHAGCQLAVQLLERLE